MRLVLAIVSFLLAAAMITVGLVQRTVLAPPDAVDLAVSTTGSAQLTIIDGATLQSHEGRQTLTISGSPQIVAAYGRSTDVQAWIGDAAYNEITLDPDSGELVSTRHPGSNEPLPELYGSDLWLDDYRDIQQLRLSVTLPDEVTLILASSSGMPAPSEIAISWPLDSSTPWSGPLIIGGAAVFVLGLILFLVAIYRIRSNHGPKRKMPKVPKRKAITSVRPGTKPVAGALPRANGKSASKVGSGSALVLLLVAAVALGGLPHAAPAVAAETPPATPDPSPTPTPSPTPAEPSTPIPAVTTVQLDRIVEKVITTISQADTTLDLELLDSRMHGPALALKTADYTIRSKDAAAVGESPVIPERGVVALSLPQQVPADTPSWPRTVFVVVAPPEALGGSAPAPTPSTTAPAEGEAAPTEEPAVETPVVMLLTQATPRDNYEVEYLMTLQADVPEVAAPTVGAPVLRPDTPLLSTAPQEIVDGYADVLALGEASEWAERFDLRADTFSAAWGLEAQAAYQAGQAGLESPNTVSYGTDDTESRLVTLATTDAGAIVTGTVQQSVTVAPSEEGAKVIAQGKVLTLSGVERSERGYVLNYIGQLLFFVPPLGSDAPITVLAYAQGLASAVEAS